MKWNDKFDSDNVPDIEDIRRFIGDKAGLWDDLTDYLRDTYKVRPDFDYSRCSAQPGWNIKYKRSGKSLCTIYPMDGYFIALVVVGNKEEETVKDHCNEGLFTPYVSELYKATGFSAMGKWLMIKVTNREILEDVKKLVGIRIKPQNLQE
ncbi:DUF3788 domain-containing protein [Alkalibacter saccharofermentans]|uniref:DUF3788 domain-containing protein n=1 Tax=Alkalibacter saccharofermentans DSM 14828 TaxID=1120975 RepID=A0A1M4URM6_9FIRM|nr:DUF3788 domain-containing protein [Alkalibacter saccharofermentans]SHE59297.1 Protein of unknown function [Alkalibacter saccharofermentans DSM 14828]